MGFVLIQDKCVMVEVGYQFIRNHAFLKLVKIGEDVFDIITEFIHDLKIFIGIVELIHNS